MISYDDVQVFLALARSGTYARAARTLRVDATTVGRRLAALEQGLGAQLFERSARSLQLTEAGTLLRPRAERIEAELLAAERELRGNDERIAGTVRLTASDGVLDALLVPALPALLARHSNLTVELRADARMVDLSRREADVAVRLVRPRESALVVQRLGALRFGLFASPHYLARCGTPRSVGALREHAFIGASDALADTLQVRWLTRMVPGRREPVRANSTSAQARACAEGLGLALLPVPVARERNLVPVLPAIEMLKRELYGVVHSATRKNAKVAAVVVWLREALANAL